MSHEYYIFTKEQIKERDRKCNVMYCPYPGAQPKLLPNPPLPKPVKIPDLKKLFKWYDIDDNEDKIEGYKKAVSEIYFWMIKQLLGE